jgi:cell division protein FtsL
MTSTIIILVLLFSVLIYTYQAPAAKVRRRMKKLEKIRKETQRNQGQQYNEEARKSALNIPGYYEDIVNKGKLKKTYKWELHDSI